VLSPYLMLAALPSVILFALSRRWIAATAALFLTVATVAVQLPLFVGSGGHREHSTDLRVMTANIRLGQADATSLVASARDYADIVAVQELTPEAVQRLSSAGMDAAFPHRALDARDDGPGFGLWSRYPLRDVMPITAFVMPAGSARIQLRGVAIDPTIVVAHVAGPWPQSIDGWRADFAVLPVTMASLAKSAGPGAVIVAGDFNATFDERPFRDLLRNGYFDAAEQVGAGWTPTYPGDRWIPPLLGVDHVVIRNCAASSVRTVPLPGSDHRALVATVEIH
jgi:endonuclease/exonuclease/phosphatase (EEP) superfamily protein YafD